MRMRPLRTGRRHTRLHGERRRRARLLELASRISDCPSDLIDLVEERLPTQGRGPRRERDTIGVALHFCASRATKRRSTWASRAAESALLGLGDDHEEYLRWLACARGDFLEANAQQDFMMALATLIYDRTRTARWKMRTRRATEPGPSYILSMQAE